MHRAVLFALAAFSGLCATPALSAGDLTRQEPVEVRVDLGSKGSKDYLFSPNSFTFETGKLYKLMIHNPSSDPHYFTASYGGNWVTRSSGGAL